MKVLVCSGSGGADQAWSGPDRRCSPAAIHDEALWRTADSHVDVSELSRKGCGEVSTLAHFLFHHSRPAPPSPPTPTSPGATTLLMSRETTPPPGGALCSAPFVKPAPEVNCVSSVSHNAPHLSERLQQQWDAGSSRREVQKFSCYRPMMLGGAGGAWSPDGLASPPPNQQEPPPFRAGWGSGPAGGCGEGLEPV